MKGIQVGRGNGLPEAVSRCKEWLSGAFGGPHRSREVGELSKKASAGSQIVSHVLKLGTNAC